MGGTTQKRSLEAEANESTSGKRAKTDEGNAISTLHVVSTNHISPSGQSIEPEEILQRISHEDLKSLFGRILYDHVSGPMAASLLKVNKDRALSFSSRQAQNLCDTIIKQSSEAIMQLYEDTDEDGYKGSTQVSEFPATLDKFLSQVLALIKMGSIVRGPELAWKVLLHLAQECIHDWSGGMHVYGDESDCDYFHNDIDNYMLTVCMAQNQAGNNDWYVEDRRDELVALAGDAEIPEEGVHDGVPPLQYRCQKTFDYLSSRAPKRERLAVQDLCC